MNYKKVLSALSLPLLAGCSAFGIDGDFFNSRTIQAEDRMLLVTEKAPVLNKATGEIRYTKRVLCAEPSPDAMSAIAFSGALEGSYQGATGGLTQSFGQSLGELGERTPVIQMLRDSLYRACEAHMNGLLSEDEYYEILAFFDIYSATVLAIETLTRSPRAPVTINASGTAANSGKSSLAQDEGGGQSEHTGMASATGGGESPAVAMHNAPSKETAEAIKGILDNYYKTKLTLFSLMKLDPESRKDYLRSKLEIGSTSSPD
ncbi:MAG: hypothetical protein ACU843_13035 [Gammaproteobacteria bacterium]